MNKLEELTSSVLMEAQVSPKKERALKKVIATITKQYPRDFKAKHYRITVSWVNDFKAHLEFHIDNPALADDKKSYSHLIREVSNTLHQDDNVTKSQFLGGATEDGPYHYAVWELVFPYNL